jgi:cytochrome c peroxidase
MSVGVRAAAIAVCLLVSGGTGRGAEPVAARPPEDQFLGLPRGELAQQPPDPGLVKLGRTMFSDSRLSVNGKVSCATCHIQGQTLADGLPVGVGMKGLNGTRNTPSLFNVRFLHALFWDGRAADLETQAEAPLTGPREHGFQDARAVVEAVRLNKEYVVTLLATFHLHSPAEIRIGHITAALAAYERTLLAGNSPFDRYLYGGMQNAISAKAAAGLELFRGRARCVSCHTIGPESALLTDEQYHDAPGGLSNDVAGRLGELTAEVIRLKQTGNAGELNRAVGSDAGIAALGRFGVTLSPADIGRFKTPTLRNVALTAPYMHDGRIKSLGEAVEAELYGRGDAVNRPIVLTVQERSALVAFLESLTSPAAGVSRRLESVQSRLKRHPTNSPTIPRRNTRTQAANTTPRITVTQPPTMSDRYSCRVTTMVAPSTGPRNVPAPPTRVMRMTSPEVPCSTSESVAKPSTSALSAPAIPASVADNTKASSL